MNLIYLSAAIFTLLTAVVFAMLFRKLAAPGRLVAFNSDWLDRFSTAKYKPMERLLSEDDFLFVESQQGCNPALVRRLRVQRERIFREYLGCLRRDFYRLESLLRFYMMQCQEDRPELAKAMLRRRVRFSYALTVVEFRLLLCHFGLGTVDIRGLLAPLDAMRAQLGLTSLARQASIA